MPVNEAHIRSEIWSWKQQRDSANVWELDHNPPPAPRAKMGLYLTM